MNYPLVLIHCIDHSANDSGNAGPYSMLVTGVLVNEDKHGYYLKHMVFEGDPHDDANVSSFVAKTAGLSIRVIGYITLRS